MFHAILAVQEVYVHLCLNDSPKLQPINWGDQHKLPDQTSSQFVVKELQES